MTQTLSECCENVNPCDAIKLLNRVMLDIGTGQFVSAYKIGEESFTISKPSIDNVRALIDYYKTLCTDPEITGLLRRRRASVKFVHDNNHPDYFCRSGFRK